MIAVRLGKCLLLDLLQKRGWNQAILCEKTGLKKSQVSEYINDHQLMSLKTAFLISEVIGCQVNDLYSYNVIEK